MKVRSTSKSDLGLVHVPKYLQDVSAFFLAAVIAMSTSLAGADEPVGAGLLGDEVSRDLPPNLGVIPALPDSVHFGKCLDLVELQDGTIIMMVGAPDDDDQGRSWSQGNAAGSVFVFKRSSGSSEWTPFINEGDPGEKPSDFKLYSPDPQPGEQFGWSLDLDVDQEGVCRAVIGAPGRTHELYFNGEGRIPDAGAAYVFRLDDDDCWVVEQQITLEMLNFDWSQGGGADSLPGSGTLVQVNPIADWPPRLPLEDPGDEDTLAQQLRIGVNAPQNPDLEVTLPEPFNAPNGAPMAKFVSIPGERFGHSVSIVADTIAIGAPFRSVHLFDLYDQFAGIECDDETPSPWASDQDNRLWEAGVDVFEYFTVLDSCVQTFPAVGTIGAPGSGAAFLFRRSGKEDEPNPWWIGDVDPLELELEPQTSWQDDYFRGRILHDDLGNPLAWNVSLGSAVKLVVSDPSPDEGTGPLIDLVVSATQADFTFTGMTHVYRDVWNRPPHTRSDVSIRDAGASFNSPGKYGFDLDAFPIDEGDDGYLLAIGQPGFNFAGYPGFSWNGTAHTYFVPNKEDADIDGTPIDESLLPVDGFSFSIPRLPDPVQVVCGDDGVLLQIPACTNCEVEDVFDLDDDGNFLEHSPPICLTGGDPYNLQSGGFGMSVDLVGVGDNDSPVLLVGAPRSKYLDDLPEPIKKGDPPAPEGEMSGVVYSYEVDIDVFTPVGFPPTASTTIVPKEVLRSNEEPGQYQLLGQFVRGIQDGDDILLAASQPTRSPDQFVDTGFRKRIGSVAIFDLDDVGEDSTSDDNLASLTVAPDVRSLADRSNFGQAIDIGGDVMVVSAPYATLPLEGEAFDLYEDMNSFPPETAFPTFTGIYGLFGASERMGEVWVYRRNGGCSDIGGQPSRGWVLVSVIRPPELNALAADPSFRRLAPFFTPNMGFGTSVDLSADGKFLVVGAEQGGWRRPEDAINGENATGGAYLYELANQGCDPIFLGMPGRYLNEFGQPLQGALGSRQGKSVSVENRGNNGFVLAGAPSSSLGGTLAGYATLAEIRSNQLSFRDPIRLPPNDLGIPVVGIAAEQGRKPFDFTGDAVALIPGAPRIAVFSSPNRRYFNGDPAGPEYLDVRGRVSSLLTSTFDPTQTLLPELGMQNFGGTLAMARARSLVAIGLDTDRRNMPGMRSSTCSDFGGAVQVRSVSGGSWNSNFVSLPYLISDDSTFCPPEPEVEDAGTCLDPSQNSLFCLDDCSDPVLCDEPMGDWSNNFSPDYGSALSFSTDGRLLMIGDMGRTNRGLCLQSPDTSEASGLYDIWYRSGTSGEDLCDWSRVGIGNICDGRVGQRLAWDVAIDAESEDFYASAFSTSPPPDPFAPAPCSPRSLESRSAVLTFSSDAEDCNDNCIDDALELADPATDCDLDGNLDECQIRDDAELDRNLDGILDACQCLADVNGDGVVNQEDIDEVLQWIEDNLEDPTCFGCPEDINGDGLVDIADIVEINLNLGACP